MAWNDLLGHHQLGLLLSLAGSGIRDGTPHAEEAAARWRENTSSFDFDEEVAAAASMEAAARAMVGGAEETLRCEGARAAEGGDCTEEL